jgi:hypothetical protein
MKNLNKREEKINKFKEMALKVFDDGDADDVDLFMGFSNQLMALLNGYEPSGIYKGQATLLRTTQNLISYDSKEFWGMEEVYYLIGGKMFIKMYIYIFITVVLKHPTSADSKHDTFLHGMPSKNYIFIYIKCS